MERIAAAAPPPAQTGRANRILGFLLSHDAGLSANRLDTLTVAAVAYLALPNLIFLGGWLKPPFALAMTALLLLSLGTALGRRSGDWHWPHARPATVVIVCFAFAWAAFGGAGHLMHANIDWHVRDAVLADLAFGDWPVSYGIVEGRHLILRTALGYFLPAALAGKLLGVQVLDAALYCWTALGTALFLFLLPLPRAAGRPLLGLLAIVTLFSGMDIVGFLIVQEGEPPMFPGRLEWYIPLSYSSLSAHLLWAPNHALPIWLATALFVRHWKHPDFAPPAITMFGLLFVWTPFAPIALAPFYVLLALESHRTRLAARLQPARLLAVAAGPVLLSLFMVRLLTSHFDLPVGVPSAAPATGAAEDVPWLRHYLLFVLVEFGILAIYLGRMLRHSHGLFWTAGAILAGLPLAKLGPSNDLMLRASLPALIVLLVLTLDTLRQPKTANASGKGALIAILILGFPTAISELWRSAAYPRWPADYLISLPEAMGRGQLPAHYVARLDRPELLLLLRAPAIVPTAKGRLTDQRRDPAESR